MRRGLMRWDKDELPADALATRLARLRAAMARERFDAFLIYTNLVRPSAVCWLTGFTPYWSEGALLVLPGGAPIFATALSKRVASWIESTNPVSEVVTAPRYGKLLGARLTQAGAKRVGALEFDALPTALAEDVASAAPDTALVDGSATFAGLRRMIDAAERALLLRADAIAREALAQIDGTAVTEAGVVAGEVEKHARLAGAEEAYIAVAPDLVADRRLLRINKPSPLGETFAVRASIAYKGCWVRRTRSFARANTASALMADVDAWQDELVNTLARDNSLAPQLERAARTLGAYLQNWIAESAFGSYPLQVIATKEAAAAATASPDFLVLTTALTINGRPWLGAVPALPPAA